MEANEKFLRDAGWKWIGCDDFGNSRWEDPLSVDPKKSEVRPGCTLPVPGGGTEVIMQTVVPPCNWRHTTAEAVRIQRSRDEAGVNTLEVQIANKEKELEELYRKQDAKKAEAKPDRKAPGRLP